MCLCVRVKGCQCGQMVEVKCLPIFTKWPEKWALGRSSTSVKSPTLEQALKITLFKGKCKALMTLKSRPNVNKSANLVTMLVVS